MKDLKIEMLFRAEHENDEIHITVNGQRFIQKYNVFAMGRDIDINRERARAFGEKLIEMGKAIERQAEHGKPSERVIEHSGLKYITF